MSDKRFDGFGKPQSYSPLERGVTSMMWRPQAWFKGLPDYTSGFQRNPYDAQAEEYARPSVLRTQAFQQQDDDERVYVEKPMRALERGGTARGGLFYCLPGQRVNVYDSPRVNPVTRAQCEAHVIYHDKVWRAYGRPELSDGSAQNGGYRTGKRGDDLVTQWRDPADSQWKDMLLIDGPDGLVYGPGGLLFAFIDDLYTGPDKTWSSEKIHAEDNLREVQTCSLYTGGALSVNGGDPLKFDIAAGTGVFVNHWTTPNYPTGGEFSFGPHTALDPLNYATEPRTYVLIDPTTGNVIRQNTPPTESQIRQQLFLGIVYHITEFSVIAVISAPIVANETAATFRDFMLFYKTYTGTEGFIIEQSVVAPLALSFLTGEGTNWTPGINFHTDPLNPNTIDTPAQDQTSFYYISQRGIESGPTTLVDPKTYDDGVGLSTVPNNRSSIQYVYVNVQGQVFVQYGQKIYQTYDDALASVSSDWLSLVKPVNYPGTITVLAAFIMDEDATYLVDPGPNPASIINFRERPGSAGGTSGLDQFTDLVDTPNSYVGEARRHLRVTDSEVGLEFVDEPMRWRGDWVAGSYEKNDVVLDGAWLMVANKDTADRAAPQPTGPEVYVYPGAGGTNSATAKFVIFGMRYTFARSGYITGYRIYTVAGNVYRIFTVSGSTGEVSEILTFEATTTGWAEFPISRTVILAGASFDLVAQVNEPDPTPTIWSANYDYNNPQNPGAPGTGEIRHSRSQPGVFAIHKTDDDGTDRTAQLLALAVGDIINGAGVSWSIQSKTDQGTYWDFGVAPAANGSPTGVQNFDFETVTPTPITYFEDVDYWLGDANKRGLLGIDTDYPSIVPDDSQYGMDIKVQDADVSEDWDLMSTLGGGGGEGGGGASLFTDLNDTPSSYVGQGSKVVAVKATEDGLEFVAGGGAPEAHVNHQGETTLIYSTTYPTGSFTDTPTQPVTSAAIALDPAKKYLVTLEVHTEYFNFFSGSFTDFRGRIADGSTNKCEIRWDLAANGQTSSFPNLRYSKIVGPGLSAIPASNFRLQTFKIPGGAGEAIWYGGWTLTAVEVA